jgi:hypothetical protein
MLRGRGLSCAFIKNQASAFDLVRGRMTDKNIDKIMKIVHNRSPGKRRVRDQTVIALKRQMKKLFEVTKEVFEEEWYKKNPLSRVEFLDKAWKSFRMTEEKSKKYFLYWALMGTISQRKGRVIGVSTEKEKDFFGKSYRIMRKALIRMKLLDCTDPTYCPGVKCQDWQVKVMAKIESDIDLSLQSSEAEKAFFKIKDTQERIAYASTLSKHAYEFLSAKEKVLEGVKRIYELNDSIKSTYFIIKEYGKENGKKFTSDKFSRIDMFRAHKVFFKKQCKEFLNKFSDKATYDWGFVATGRTEELIINRRVA